MFLMLFNSTKIFVTSASLFVLAFLPLQTPFVLAGGWFEGDISAIEGVNREQISSVPGAYSTSPPEAGATSAEITAQVPDSSPPEASISASGDIDMCNPVGWWIWFVIGVLLLFSFAYFVWPTEDRDRARRTALSLFMLLIASTLTGMHLCLLNSWLNMLILAVGIYLLLKITSKIKKEPTS
jgi:hypothetical protein